MEARSEIRRELTDTLIQLGQETEFSVKIARTLGSEKAMLEMLGYLRQKKPQDTAEILAEMQAILDGKEHYLD